MFFITIKIAIRVQEFMFIHKDGLIGDVKRFFVAPRATQNDNPSYPKLTL